MLRDWQMQAALWKTQRPSIHLLHWPHVSADCKRSNLAFRAIWLAGRTLPDDLSVCKGLSAGDQCSQIKQEKQGPMFAFRFQVSSMLYVRTWFPPDWGHRRIPSVSLCIIAFPLPRVHFLHHTRPPSLFITNVITLLFAGVKNKHFGTWTGGCSLYLRQIKL